MLDVVVLKLILEVLWFVKRMCEWVLVLYGCYYRIFMLILKVIQVPSVMRLIHNLKEAILLDSSTCLCIFTSQRPTTGMSQLPKPPVEEKCCAISSLLGVTDANANRDRQRHRRAACVTCRKVHVILQRKEQEREVRVTRPPALVRSASSGRFIIGAVGSSDYYGLGKGKLSDSGL